MKHIPIPDSPVGDWKRTIARCVADGKICNTASTVPVYYLVESVDTYRVSPSDVFSIEDAIRSEFPDITDDMMQVVKTEPCIDGLAFKHQACRIYPQYPDHAARTAILVQVPKSIYDNMKAKYPKYYTVL